MTFLPFKPIQTLYCSHDPLEPPTQNLPVIQNNPTIFPTEPINISVKAWSPRVSIPAIEVEFQKHESWKAKTQLRATPAIIVNGYKLPDNYKIEDLRYFTEFIVDNK